MKMAGADTRLIPGIGPIIKRTDPGASRDMIFAIQGKVPAAYRAGQDPADVLAAQVHSSMLRRPGRDVAARRRRDQAPTGSCSEVVRSSRAAHQIGLIRIWLQGACFIQSTTV